MQQDCRQHGLRERRDRRVKGHFPESRKQLLFEERKIIEAEEEQFSETLLLPIQSFLIIMAVVRYNHTPIYLLPCCFRIQITDCPIGRQVWCLSVLIETNYKYSHFFAPYRYCNFDCCLQVPRQMRGFNCCSSLACRYLQMIGFDNPFKFFHDPQNSRYSQRYFCGHYYIQFAIVIYDSKGVMTVKLLILQLQSCKLRLQHPF